jgi:multiple sugar transport system permease protein
LISPWLIGFVLFVAGPLIFSFVVSLTDWDIVSSARFVGLRNYERAFTGDRFFYKALGNTLIYVVGSVPTRLLLALGMALLLNQRIRGVRLWRTAVYLPAMISIVAMGLTWGVLLNPRTGLVNYLLSLVGIVGPKWLGSAVWSKPALILVTLMYVGPQMVIFLAGLKGIPQEMYESAELDGAGPLAKFRFVTLPFLSPTIFFNLVTGIIFSFQVFSLVFVVMGQEAGGYGHGPLNSTLVYALHLYEQAFQYLNMGYASALAMLLFFFVLALTLLQLRYSRWVHYQGGMQ